ALRAPDGIRSRNVTGVQTCALPISDPYVNLPTYGSVITLNANAEKGSLSSAGRVVVSSETGTIPSIGGISVGAGRYSSTPSSTGWEERSEGDVGGDLSGACRQKRRW